MSRYPALGGAALAVVLEIPVSLARGWGSRCIASLVVAIIFVVMWERAFPPIKTVAKVPPRKASIATEDADVDELLHLIATAEDKLATNHTSVRVVMITDMKSFSRMTEEDGSVATAKAIQRHRDLLLPVIQPHNGSGKSTGGDGLVASFESAADALLAATELQRDAGEPTTPEHPNEREIGFESAWPPVRSSSTRAGARSSAPGSNLAARVMNLADGGQVFSAADVAQAADGVGLQYAVVRGVRAQEHRAPGRDRRAALGARPAAARPSRHRLGTVRVQCRVASDRRARDANEQGPDNDVRALRVCAWSWRQDLNPQPTDYKSVALPIELRQRARISVREGRAPCQLIRSAGFAADRPRRAQQELQRRICVSILRLTRCSALSTAFVCRPSESAIS